MRESGFRSQDSGAFRKNRSFSDSRSRFEERLGPRSEFGNEPRSFPPPPPSRSSGGGFGNSSFSSRESNNSRYESDSRGPSRFGNDGGPRFGDGPQYGNSGPNFGNNGPSYGNSGPSNFGNSGPPNFGNSGPSNYGNSGPNFGSGGPPPSGKDMGPQGGQMMGPMRDRPMGGGGMRNSNFGGNPPNEPDIFTSIQTLSQMSAQQSDIATKIISAVLSNNFMGNSGSPPFQQGQMGGFSDRNQFPPSRSSMQSVGQRLGGPPGGFNRLSRERGRNPRISFSGSSYKSSYDRRYDSGKRSFSLKNVMTKKRPLSDSSPKDSSKFKRRRSISHDGDESIKKRDMTKEEDKNNESESKKDSDDKSEDGDKKDDFPLPALYCHMCKHGNFTSVKTYLYHLEGVKHKKTALAFHAKNEATLEYLRKNAKLASIRFGGKDNSVTPSKCTICTAVVKETFLKHKRLLEHRVVKKFMNPSCCGRYFKTRYDMNEHRLSLPHLKKIYDSSDEQKMFMDECVKVKPGKWTHDDIVKQLKSRNPIQEKRLTLDNISPFDGNTFIGIKFLRRRESTLCKPCKILLPVGIKSMETHMVTIDHYDNVLEYLREKRKKKMEAGDKAKKGEGEAAAISDSDESDEDADGDGEAEVTRVSDDEDEDEGTVVPIKLTSDDEDEKEDLPYIDETAHIVLEEIGEDLPMREHEDEDDDDEDKDDKDDDDDKEEIDDNLDEELVNEEEDEEEEEKDK